MIITFLVLSIILNIILTYGLYRASKNIDILETWIINFKNQMESLYNYLTYIDDKDMFQKDDEVGILFEDIKNAISSTKKIILDDEENKDSKKK